MSVHSQLAPLPTQVPFRLISKTIGSGAYACIKKAIPEGSPSPVFAVKFIHKAYAQKHGRVSLKQLNLEITLHAHLGQHPNIIQFFQAGEDAAWKWIAMELAEGGDLFDKIESDVGVGEDVAHVYFTQLVGAVEFMHQRGVGHRDLKPENVLLSREGVLKVADFGLATLFEHGGKRKGSKTSCGSPPYTAPEVMRCERVKKGEEASVGYYADQVDVWSCGVVLFVLLVGNTPWDSPSKDSYEYVEYISTDGRPDDELFQRLPDEAYDLLRGILAVDPRKRFTMRAIRQHPWFTRPNRFLKADGGLSDPVGLATTMFQSMKVDLSQNPFVPSSQSQAHSGSAQTLHSPDRTTTIDDGDAMEVDDSQPTRTNTAIISSEVAAATPVAEITFDWERPATQQVPSATPSYSPPSQSSLNQVLTDEPNLSQFTPAPAVPLSRTQFARKFGDILPADTVNQFYSSWEIRQLLQLIGKALKDLGIPMPADPAAGLSGSEETTSLSIRAKDGRGQKMRGEVVLQALGYGEGTYRQVTFVKMHGDPVEWRRLFKRVVVLCKEAVHIPEPEEEL